MRVLIDECAPRALKSFLSNRGFDCSTVQESGWSGKQNGALLALAEPSFDVFVTLDTNLKYQQNLTGRRIAVVVLLAHSNRLVDLTAHFPTCAAAIQKIHPGDIVFVGETE